MGVVDVLALPVFLRSLQQRYPSCQFQTREVGEEPGGTQASIAILDTGGVRQGDCCEIRLADILIRAPRTWTIPCTAPIGVGPPKRGCPFA
jgi:hypothetical protein